MEALIKSAAKINDSDNPTSIDAASPMYVFLKTLRATAPDARGELLAYVQSKNPNPPDCMVTHASAYWH